ncbi:DUF2510 domain-containing protein [Mycobacterium kubicae]|uniref:DUF2510 domain-containing protein n=2 Tax=Mycobacterium kubicae TaxID=120959 RepID=UPI000A65DF76|nr:DUF2510 domain-containing protein [Mycobacterium kubicae]
MLAYLLLVVAALIGVVVVAGFIVLMIRLTSPKPDSNSYVPHGWQTAPTSAPGWYPDAHDPAVLRYFDGQAWTADTRRRG